MLSFFVAVSFLFLSSIKFLFCFVFLMFLSFIFLFLLSFLLWFLLFCFRYYLRLRGEHFSIELTYNHGVESYNIGDGFNCIGLRLPDVEGIANRAKAAGGEIVSGPEASLS